MKEDYEKKNKIKEKLEFELEKAEFLLTMTNKMKELYKRCKELSPKHIFHYVINKKIIFIIIIIKENFFIIYR